MDFGMIPYDGLSEKDFLFRETEQPHLPGVKSAAHKVYVGLSKWTYKEELKKKSSANPLPGTLPFYAGLFNAIELNATHYDVPDAEKAAKWYAAAQREDFMFCPKLHKSISHLGNIDIHKFGQTKQFMESVERFKEKLGSSFLQLPEKTGISEKEKILAFLKLLPASFALSVELRNPDWFADEYKLDAFVAALHALNKGMVITDTPGRRDAVHMKLSNTTAFIRFVCRGDHELDMFRIDQWQKQLKSWFWQGLERCYFFLHIHNAEFEDDFIAYVKEGVGKC